MASSAGYLGIAAFLSEASLVQALCKAQTGKALTSLISLQGKHATQQHDPKFAGLLFGTKRLRDAYAYSVFTFLPSVWLT